MSSSEPQSIRVGAPIRRRLARARRAIVATEFGRRLALSLAIAVALFAVLLIADAAFELPAEFRQAGLWLTLIVSVATLVWTISALITARRDDEELALLVERQNPKLDSRLISAVQFAQGQATIPEGAPLEMAQAMVGEAEAEAARTDFLRVLDPRHAARAALVLMAVGVGASAWALANRDIVPTLVARAFGDDSPMPRETRITASAGDALVGIGDRVELVFTAEGVLPEQGELDLRYASGRREKAPLQRDPETPGRYVAAIDEVPETFTFSAEINDAETDEARITAIERPAVEALTAIQNYPEFTGLASTEHAPGDFALLPGSKLDFTLTANKTLATATLRFVGNDQTLDLAVDGTRATASFDVPTDTLGGFTVALTGDQGLESRDETVYRVTLLTDRPPEVRITFPRRTEELVTRRARVLVRYEASDRFGIASAALRYQRDGQSEVGSLPVTVPSPPPKSIEGELEWDLSQLTPPVSEGEIIDYWFEATDQNTRGDRTGRTDSLRIKVVSADEKRADLLGRAADTLGGVSETTNDQERLNAALKTLIEDASSDD